MNKDYTFKIESGRIGYDTKYGAEIYRRSLSILLECAISELYPSLSIRVGQTLMKGYYYAISEGGYPRNFIEKVTDRMNLIVSLNEKFRKVRMGKTEALKLCKKVKRDDKFNAILYLPDEKINVVFLRNYFDFLLAESVSAAGCLKTFRIIRYNNGFILQFPLRGNIKALPETKDRQRKLYEVYMESRQWNEILGIRNAGDLNRAVLDGSIRDLINVQEALHEKKIANIADTIKNFFPRKRIICVAGPSASGKTTFIKRLGVQLRADGLDPVELSLDNYFVSREKTPKTADGDYDYECLKAIDLEFFRKQMSEILKGKEVKLPEYDFKIGDRKDSGIKLKLNDRSVILVEGIHSLNPRLLPKKYHKKLYNIFVSALTQLCIDNDNRIFTSDYRLMRRFVRDRKFRGYTASESIARFPKVRDGEDKYIFPFQPASNVFFNSSLIYEPAVIKPMVEKLLKKIRKSDAAYFEAQRLLYYLNFFLPISPKRVPQNSILREFIGKSSFHY